MPCVRKTHDEWWVQGNFGYGWEYVCCFEDKADARRIVCEYSENDSRYVYRIKKRRVRNDEGLGEGNDMADLRNVEKGDLYHTIARWGGGDIDFYTGSVRDRETNELIAIIDVYDLGDRHLSTVTNVYEGTTQHFGESDGGDGVREMQRYVMCHFPNKYCVLKAELV